jgi:hypothetical protein
VPAITWTGCLFCGKVPSSDRPQTQYSPGHLVGLGNCDSSVSGRAPRSLCDRFAKTYPTRIAELRKKRTHYLAFLKFPESMRKSFSTTKVVEAINGQLEIMGRNSGGHFHSEDTLKFKLGMAIFSLEEGHWRAGARGADSKIKDRPGAFQSICQPSVG